MDIEWMFVRYVLALFDAPIPASAACRALVAVGIEPLDVAVFAMAEPAGWDSPYDMAVAVLAASESAARLSEMGVPAAEVLLYLEGLRQRGVLVAVRTPTAHAALAAACLNAVGAPSLLEHAALWHART